MLKVVKVEVLEVMVMEVASEVTVVEDLAFASTIKKETVHMVRIAGSNMKEVVPEETVGMEVVVVMVTVEGTMVAVAMVVVVVETTVEDGEVLEVVVAVYVTVSRKVTAHMEPTVDSSTNKS